MWADFKRPWKKQMVYRILGEASSPDLSWLGSAKNFLVREKIPLESADLGAPVFYYTDDDV